MGFNPEKFSTTTFKDRVQAVPVPRLAAFFDLERISPPHSLAGIACVSQGKRRTLDVDFSGTVEFDKIGW